MAFNGASYFAGIGTVVAAVGLGFACGAMITDDVVQPPNRLERANAAKAPQNSAAPSQQQQASAAKPASLDIPPSPVVAAAPSPVASSQPAPQPQPAAAASRSDDQAPAGSVRTTVGRATDPGRDESRSAELNRETTGAGRDGAHRRTDVRKPADARKFSERKRRQDQDDRRLDEATNVVRQMRPGGAVDVVVGPDETPRFGGRPGHFELFDDDGPRVVNAPPPPPRLGFFGN